MDKMSKAIDGLLRAVDIYVAAKQSISNGSDKEYPKRRGKGVLDNQVWEALRRFGSDVTGKSIRDYINKRYRDIYKPTTYDAVAKTRAWLNRKDHK